MLMKVEALDHKNNIARPRIKQWASRVSRWYPSNSKKTHMIVIAIRTPADPFLSLHRKTSAAVTFIIKIQFLSIACSQKFAIF